MSPESTKGKKTKKTTPEPQESQKQSEPDQQPVVSRKQIAIRLLYTILFLAILGIVTVIVKIVVLFQFIYFFSTREPNQSVRQFSNKLSTYAYKLFRYITLNDNQRPFPFSDLPPEQDPVEVKVIFD